MMSARMGDRVALLVLLLVMGACAVVLDTADKVGLTG